MIKFKEWQWQLQFNGWISTNPTTAKSVEATETSETFKLVDNGSNSSATNSGENALKNFLFHGSSFEIENSVAKTIDSPTKLYKKDTNDLLSENRDSSAITGNVTFAEMEKNYADPKPMWTNPDDEVKQIVRSLIDVIFLYFVICNWYFFTYSLMIRILREKIEKQNQIVPCSLPKRSI